MKAVLLQLHLLRKQPRFQFKDRSNISSVESCRVNILQF